MRASNLITSDWLGRRRSSMAHWRARLRGFVSGTPRDIDDWRWRTLLAELPLFDHLDADQLALLRSRTNWLLEKKNFIGCGGMVLDEHHAALIAVQMALPILHLGPEWYAGWQSVLVYPEAFEGRQSYEDHNGIVHDVATPLVGEAWSDGPLVFSWLDVLQRGHGFNVVLHECAHKFDLLNGVDNGFPPLHDEMDSQWWTKAFALAYRDFVRRVDGQRAVPFDAYAAASPGEFFAVVTEVFFEQPVALRQEYPLVYRQLVQFYRQDPLCIPES